MADTVALQTIPEAFQPSDLDQQEVYLYDDQGKVPCAGSETPTYMDLSSNSPCIKQEYQDDFSLMSWTQKHPEHWTSNEVLDWIYFLADKKDVDCTKLRGEAFQSLTGHQLSMMSLQDYVNLDPVYGHYLYEMFRSMYSDASFIGPAMDNGEQYSFYTTENIKTEQPDTVDYQTTDRLLDGVLFNEQEMRVRLGDHWYPIDVDPEVDIDDMLFNNNYEFHSSGSSESDTASDANAEDLEANHKCIDGLVHRLDSTGSDPFSDEESMYPTKKAQSQKRKQKRTKSSSSGDDCDERKTNNRGRKQGQLSKGNHLWEFIRDLLKDPKFNPHLLRWEEKDTGVFRFVQSEAVARMWGRKKNNPGMTYEKLSRAMRYYYKRGILDRVDGRRLVYKFGVNSHGWK